MIALSIIILSLVLSFTVFALVAVWYIFIIGATRHVSPQFAVKTKKQASTIPGIL